MCEDFTRSMLRKQACSSSDADAGQEVQPNLGDVWDAHANLRHDKMDRHGTEQDCLCPAWYCSLSNA